MRNHYDSLDLAVDLFWIRDQLLSPAECQALIARAEAIGFAEAPITTSRGPVMRRDIRNNERVMVDDPTLAGSLYQRALPFLPPRMMGMELCGANERLRYYRYHPGQRFAPHMDGAFIRTNGEESFLTFMIYLNEGFTGGSTLFLDHETRVLPVTGRALFFQHMLLHEGCEVETGVKYVLRTDVMFRPIPPAG
jgi:predicted 2-oxoglutarate/Fe(II)-dependent dioxygenase YbiX